MTLECKNYLASGRGGVAGTAASNSGPSASSGPSSSQGNADNVSNNCDSAYPDTCIPPPPLDLNYGDVSQRNFEIGSSDPHGFDADNDGIGCES